jgi:hypothetical protein
MTKDDYVALKNEIERHLRLNTGLAAVAEALSRLGSLEEAAAKAEKRLHDASLPLTLVTGCVKANYPAYGWTI